MEDPPGGRPKIDASDAGVLGIHIRYMAQELHTVSDTVKEIGRAIADLQRTMPVTYAQNARVDEVSQRVNTLESAADLTTGAAPAHAATAAKVVELSATIERMRGGYIWLWTAFGVLVACITIGLGVATFALKLLAGT